MTQIAVPPEATSSGERSLAAAFVTFNQAANSLERSYGQLQAEVAQLRRELEVANHDLARSEEENCRSREHLTRLLNLLPCGVLETTGDGRVVLSNPEAKRLWGDGQQLPESIEQLLDRCQADGGELECSLEGEPVRWLAIRSRLLTGERERKIFIVQEITRLKQLQLEHEKLQRKHALAELSKLLAHEVRNPLASMELFASLLAASELSAEQQGWVEHLQAGLRMLGATVNNVLQFHSDASPQFSRLEVGEFLRALQEFIAPLAQQSDVQVVVRHNLDRVFIPADRHRLQQVFLNFALNSIRYLPEGGHVAITGELVVHDDGKWARVEVSDDGPGIAPDLLAKIFEPGFTTRPGSPGLGLSVCRTLLQQHGARITVIRPARGVTFRIELPGAQP